MNANKRWQNKLILDPACEEVFIDNRLKTGLVDFDIQLGGISDLNKNYLVERDKCKYHTIIYTRSGKGLLNTKRENKTITENSLLLLPAGSSFSYQLDKEVNNWQIIWFLIDDSSNWRWLKNKGICLNKAHNIEMIYQLSSALYQETLASSPSINLINLNTELLAAFINRDLQFSVKINSRKRQSIKMVFQQLEGKLQQPWRLETLAKLTGYSPAQFNRLCLQAFATTPMKKLRQLRMLRAQTLLKTSELNLSDIANAVGYHDVFNFSSAFKREIGMAPDHYRNR